MTSRWIIVLCALIAVACVALLFVGCGFIAGLSGGSTPEAKAEQERIALEVKGCGEDVTALYSLLRSAETAGDQPLVLAITEKINALNAHIAALVAESQRIAKENPGKTWDFWLGWALAALLTVGGGVGGVVLKGKLGTAVKIGTAVIQGIAEVRKGMAVTGKPVREADLLDTLVLAQGGVGSPTQKAVAALAHKIEGA